MLQSASPVRLRSSPKLNVIVGVIVDFCVLIHQLNPGFHFQSRLQSQELERFCFLIYWMFLVLGLSSLYYIILLYYDCKLPETSKIPMFMHLYMYARTLSKFKFRAIDVSRRRLGFEPERALVKVPRSSQAILKLTRL